MNVEKLQQAVRSRPFRPFWMCIADGREVRVAHPESIAVSLNWRVATVFTPGGDLEIVDIPLITGIVYRRRAAPKRTA
jgi:hypothetical protein